MRKKKRYEWLADVVNANGFTTGAEVGAATGITTGYVLENCPRLGMLIVADDWRPVASTTPEWERTDMEQVFYRRLRNEMNRLRILKGLSWEVARHVTNSSLDFVFIDASHDRESFMKDVEAWIHKVKIDGMICGHDLHFTGVAEGLERLLPMYNVVGVDNCWYLWMHDYAAWCQHA